MKRGLKYRLFQHFVAKSVKRNKREVIFPGLNEIRNILVLNNDEFDVGSIEDIIGGDVDCEVVRLIPEKRTKLITDHNVYLNDLNWVGIPSLKNSKAFIDKPYDLLINVTKDEIGALEYLGARSLSAFKVGRENRYSIYDLIINDQNLDTISFLKEVFKTIKNFS